MSSTAENSPLVTVRPMTGDDRLALCVWLQDEGSCWVFGGRLDSCELSETATMWTLTADGTPVAIMHCKLSGDTVWFERIVEPAKRGQRLGELIIRLVAEQPEFEHVTWFAGDVSQFNVICQRNLARLGFQVVCNDDMSEELTVRVERTRLIADQ